MKYQYTSTMMSKIGKTDITKSGEKGNKKNFDTLLLGGKLVHSLWESLVLSPITYHLHS